MTFPNSQNAMKKAKPAIAIKPSNHAIGNASHSMSDCVKSENRTTLFF